MTDQDGPPTETVTEVAERLMREFGCSVSLDTVTSCVLNAQRDLDRLALRHAPPMLLARLARARLADAVLTPGDPRTTASPDATHSAS